MTNVWAAKVQGATLANADAHGERWTRDEIDFVVSFTDAERDEDIALALGRSLYAVWALQYRVRNDGVEGVIARLARDEKREYATCPTHFVVLPITGVCDACA